MTQNGNNDSQGIDSFPRKLLYTNFMDYKHIMRLGSKPITFAEN